jgi:hypothetical protein
MSIQEDTIWNMIQCIKEESGQMKKHTSRFLEEGKAFDPKTKAVLKEDLHAVVQELRQVIGMLSNE